MGNRLYLSETQNPIRETYGRQTLMYTGMCYRDSRRGGEALGRNQQESAIEQQALSNAGRDAGGPGTQQPSPPFW